MIPALPPIRQFPPSLPCQPLREFAGRSLQRAILFYKTKSNEVQVRNKNNTYSTPVACGPVLSVQTPEADMRVPTILVSWTRHSLCKR